MCVGHVQVPKRLETGPTRIRNGVMEVAKTRPRSKKAGRTLSIDSVAEVGKPSEGGSVGGGSVGGGSGG